MVENHKSNLFQISTPAKAAGAKGKMSKVYRKRQLIVSVVGAYVLIGGLLGFVLFNSVSDNAKASDEIAQLAPVIDLVEKSSDDSLQIGDSITVRLTLQNKSGTESINNLTFELLSTKNSVKWTEMRPESTEKETKITSEQGVFKLPILSSSERAVYLVSGVLESDESNFLTVLGKVRFLNREGQQEANSNRVFTELVKTYRTDRDLIGLTLKQESFEPGQEIPVSLLIKNKEQLSKEFILSGQIYVSKSSTGEVVQTADCEISSEGICDQVIQGLEPGSYSVLFVGSDSESYSEIKNFTVTGNSSAQTNVNSQASLDFPFGSRSINGVIPVYARRVVGLNTPVNPSDVCEFEILAGDKVVTSIKTSLKNDRSCFTSINIAQVPDGEGVYNVRLKGAKASREVSFIKKPVTTLKLETSSLVLSKGSSADLLASNIVDAGNVPLNNLKVTLGIWHQDSGEYKEITSQNGNAFLVENGQFNVRLSSDNFDNGGFYSVIMFADNGLSSDFINLNFDDKEIGFSYSGVIVNDYSNLQVGKSVEFVLQNVVDKSGKSINTGECEVALYNSKTKADPILVKGVIKDGNCKVLVSADKISVSGPILVSFTSAEINSDINQSRRFFVVSGEATNFGELNFEYLPVRKNNANKLLVGPISDNFGNLTQLNNVKIQLLVDNQVKKEYTNINITEGYGEVTIPSSNLIDDKFVIKLFGSNGNELIAKEFEAFESNQNLILPQFPTTLKGDDNIKVQLSGLALDETQKCKLTFVKNNSESASEEASYDPNTDKCEFNWNLLGLRDVSKGLIKLEAGNYQYSSIVNLVAGEATNLFVVTPQIRIDQSDSLRLKLISSIITDKQGLYLKEGGVRFEYNSKIDNISITDGFFERNILASDLSNQDIRETFGAKYLDLNINAKAGVTSISKTNSLSIFLADKDVSNQFDKFEFLSAQSHIETGTSKLMSFKSEICNAILISENRVNSRILQTHRQADVCFVQVDNIEGSQTIRFEQNGHEYGEFKIYSTPARHEVKWCKTKNCIIQVIAPINSKIEAVIFDGENQYRFESEELNNIVKVNQNGLNPLKDYLVQVKFTNNSSEEVVGYKKIKGEYLVGTNN